MDNPRLDAYLAFLAYLQEGTFLSRTDFSPLAKEIAYGTCRRLLTLEWIAKQLSNNKLPRKKKERALLYTALYQYFFMEKVPLYALINESVEMAKRQCHASFASYLNALLRRLETFSLQESSDLSVRYSYPAYFVERLREEYGEERMVCYLEAMNRPAKTMVRLRGEVLKGLTPIPSTRYAVVDEGARVPEFGASKDVYIQNVTPGALLQLLAEGAKEPKRVLDLCASPGGKLLAVHDLFPEALLFANDVSEKKAERLRENLAKYQVDAVVSCSLGEEYTCDQPFDLIILDVPCSNSGVLHKRPEARWRLSEEALKEQQELQKKLLKRAEELLAPGGEIWYLTCSILQEENEEVVRGAGLKVDKMQTVFPNLEGWDGGFGCRMTRG